MNYKEGKALLESLGYILAESGETESNISEWATDNYFKLYNEKNEEIHLNFLLNIWQWARRRR